jgi:hypothetical protein
MKSAAELRLENLEILVQEAGSADALARASGVSPEYISQIRNRAIDKKTGKARNLGNQAARRLEDGMGKPLGWMDTSHALGIAEPATSNLSPPWPLKKSTAERIRALTPAQQRRADDAFDVILKGFEAEGK